jgi:hypothetical protein
MKKKRKKLKHFDKDRITNFEGYRLKQRVMVNRYPDGKLGYGKISDFHLNCSDGENYISFACELCGQYRTANVNSIIKNPTKSHLSKIKKSRGNL